KGSFRERLALLEGLPWSEVERFADNLPLTEGAARLIGTLRRLGYKTAICSGGFDVFGKRLQETLGIDYVFANHLEAVGGKLTGS
ncbi:haloacid dehalogenase-like hydrolase, partial [Shewanella algae]|uniref:haloacid dehalogenase-like hydrolase n=1 Tax=Shewanella algae TaxID=38313 RepID=UPI00313EE954